MLSTTHIKAKIQPENATSEKTIEIICGLLDTTPALLRFLTPEIVMSLTEKIDWFQALQLLQRHFEQRSNPWVFIRCESPNHIAIKQLKILYPDLVEIEIPTQSELESVGLSE